MPFTDEGRKLALENSIAQRKRQQQQRRAKVKKMFFELGMSKSAIAKELEVDRSTVWKDLREGTN